MKNHMLFVERMSDKLIYVRKTVFMQRIADAIRLGYTRYVTGELRPDQVERFVWKISDLYETEVSSATKSRRLAAGKAKSELYFYVPPKRPDVPLYVDWFLLTSHGSLPPGGEREKWSDATHRYMRLKYDAYELVRLTKPQEPKPVWTWRIEPRRVNYTREMLIHLIRQKQDDTLRQAIYSMHRMPGFAGVRQQVMGMRRLIVTEWGRSRRGPPPDMPAGFGYTRRLADAGIRLDDWPKAVRHIERTGNMPRVRENSAVISAGAEGFVLPFEAEMKL